MTILERINFEEEWLLNVNLTKENIKIAFSSLRATAQEQQPKMEHMTNEEKFDEERCD